MLLEKAIQKSIPKPISFLITLSTALMISNVYGEMYDWTGWLISPARFMQTLEQSPVPPKNFLSESYSIPAWEADRSSHLRER